MKILIVSDSHDNLPNLKKALIFAKKEKIKTLIHCGDISSAETFYFLRNNFVGKIHAVRGNADNDLKNLSATAELKIGEIKIAANHYPAKARKLAKSQKYDFVFYGHNHRPWVRIIGKTILANPGTLDNSQPAPTVAILNAKTQKLELKILK